MKATNKPVPVAIGGLGGSGTRVFAALLRSAGFHLGNDLNDALDNLTFTLLFKRASAYLDGEEAFTRLADIFLSSLRGDFLASCDDRDLIFSLASSERMGHSSDWLLQRVGALLDKSKASCNECIGWKEPNTHILIDRFLEYKRSLKYIHVLRNPYYMAYSRNQNQLTNWAQLFFDGYVDISPRNSLAFWRKSHERMLSFMQKWPKRILIVRYEDIYVRPGALIRDIEDFIDFDLGRGAIDYLNGLVGGYSFPPGQFIIDNSIFDAEDKEYIQRHWC